MLEPDDYRQSHAAPRKGEQYDRHFREFPWRRHLWKHERQILLQIVHEKLPNRPIRHLDFACGTGRILGFLHDHVAESTGVDISESMLRRCREKTPAAEILHADLTRNDVLAKRKFDLITAFRFFPNAQPELRREVAEALAWHLDKDGVLVFNNHRNATGALFRWVRRLRPDTPAMSNAEVDELLREAGFQIERVYSLGALCGYDRHPMILPAPVHDTVDWLANRLRLGRHLCQDNIFVCRKCSSLYEVAQSQGKPMAEALAV